MRPIFPSKRDISWTSCANMSFGGLQSLQQKTFYIVASTWPTRLRYTEGKASCVRRRLLAISSNAARSVTISSGGISSSR